MSSLILDIKYNKYAGEPGFFLEYSTSEKFINDKVNYHNDEFYILLDGIILNKVQLLDTNSESYWPEYLIGEYKQNGTQFFKKLKGSYYGFLYDKK